MSARFRKWAILIVPFLLTGGARLCNAAPGIRSCARLLWGGVAEFARARTRNSMSASVRRHVAAGNVSRDAVFLHPQASGRTRAEYPAVRFTAPAATRVLFLAWAGLGDKTPLDDPEHPADGVRFYVLVNGREVARTEVRTHGWQPLFADLGTVAAGERAEFTVTLATDAGAAGNSSYDWALIGDPQLVAVPDVPLPPNRTVRGTAGIFATSTADPGTRVVIRAVDADGKIVPDASVTVAGKDGVVLTRFDFSRLPACVGWQWRTVIGRVDRARGGSWTAQLVVEGAGPARAVSTAGDAVSVRVALRNAGMASLLPDDAAVVECAGKRRPVASLGPGASTTLDFELGPRPAGPVKLDWRLTSRLGPALTGDLPVFQVWPSLPALPVGRPLRRRVLRLGRTPGWLLLEDRRVRWLINPTVPGMGALFWAWTPRGWELCGSASPLVELVLAGNVPVVLRFQTAALSRVGLAGAAVRAAARGPDGALIDVRAEFSLVEAAPALAIALSATSDRPVRIAAFRGPAVHAGDRNTGENKGVAVFPGLEYLDGPERSSSTRDLAPPLNVRVAPHKFKICVPIMFVETRPEGPVTAVIWDARQRWNGRDIAPAAAFASPNFVQHQANHLMQVFLPSIPDFVPENRFLAADAPYALVPGGTVALRMFVAVGIPAPDATGAFAWFDALVGFPPPESPPRNFEEEMALCRQGFLKTVWDPESQHNKHVVGKAHGNSPGAAALLLMDARAVARGPVRNELLERVRTIARQTIREQGPGALSSSNLCHIMRAEFPFHYGEMPAGLGRLRADARAALDSQESDGGWGYYPDEQRRALGKRGTRVIGIAARNASVLAKWAAVSGDPETTGGLRRALEHMRRYTVPRGAQGWECPILEPDVLAAAYAIRTYVWAYMALGDPKLLEHARYWARTGLAFQYAWDDGKHPGMRYAGIPVFGSTFFNHSWIGLPVQWCALVYAYSLQELMRFDPDPLWKKQVEGITVSAMFQQWPMDNRELAGTYPDSFGQWFTRRNPVHINPENIEVNLLALHGLDPGLRSVRLPDAGNTVHVTAPCDLKAAVDRTRVSVDLTYLPGRTVYFTVAPVRPTASADITVGGRGLPRKPHLPGGTTGWAYDSETRLLAVGVTCDNEGRARVTLAGVTPSTPDSRAAASAWEFAADAEGWRMGHSSALEAVDGVLRITVTGSDPYAISGRAAIDAAKHRALRVRARMNRAGQVGLFWRSTVSPQWSASKNINLPLPGDNRWHELTFNLADQPDWDGRILQIRLDLEPADLPPGTRLEVDWVRPR
ncbi:MAG: hypothetical protein GXP31_19225 [Kiritimatiellaeota bacterium]|nr:hypothetical protein [Kiritimatiellota bacterium]